MRPPSANLRIYQIFYNEETRRGVEDAAIPYDNGGAGPPRLFEYGVFRSLYHEGIADGEVVGAVSWQFPQKAQLSVADMKRLIAGSPGHDLYLFDPPRYEVLPYLTYNCWRQGEYWHGREATDKVAEVFASLAAYADLDVRRLRTGPGTNIYCNYWAGNRKAWDVYMAFVEPLYRRLTADAALAQRMFVCGLPGHPRFGRHGLFPYVLERMLPTLLAARPHGLKVWRRDQTPEAQRWLRENGFAECIGIARRIDGGPPGHDVGRVADLMDLLYGHFQARTAHRPPPAMPYPAVVAALRGELPV